MNIIRIQSHIVCLLIKVLIQESTNTLPFTKFMED